MIVVSDSSPLNILVRIAAVDVLPPLFGSVLIPPAVAAELNHESTPAVIRDWLATCPGWLVVRPPAKVDPTILFNDPGEREAISLAAELGADAILVDDRRARRAAQQRGLVTIGTIGILETAAAKGLLGLPDALQRLVRTDFHIAPGIIESALARDSLRRG
ncbi:MAG: hypothetical protein KF699_05035 [Phycisphaeraceae bacterium]|nr:hypothetical protein [Phycisphaeraceae bacterium]MBX3405416.1 hypothetical protein [Phycisphaeraceae bacterium]